MFERRAFPVKKFLFIFAESVERKQPFFQISYCSGHDQFLLGTRQGNVKYSDFLPQSLFQKLTADHLLIQC